MSKFLVRDYFELPDQQLFAMDGLVVDGDIRAGMYAQIQFRPRIDMAARIHSIESARGEDGSEKTCLFFKSSPRTQQLWRNLDARGKTLEITADVGD